MSEKDFVGKGFCGVPERYGEWNGVFFCNITEKYVEWIRGSVMERNMFCNGAERYYVVNEKGFCTGAKKCFAIKQKKVLHWNGKCRKWVCNEMGMVFVVLRIK